MKKLLSAVMLLGLCAGALSADGLPAAPAAAAGPKFKKYVMDHGYFSCTVPVTWSINREKDRDEDYKIFELQLLAPKSDKAPTSIFVSYYAAENEDFDGYEDFIDRNSTNALGESKSERENYEPVKKIKLWGRRAFELAREKLVFLHPETKSDESVQLKEKIYVLPAKAGFYVLHFSAEKPAFEESLPVFEKVAKSFKGKP
ncbi:MAG: hypothetical protein A2179_05540 [Elusimicrobia bacterium GWC2_63_65]|nr:MAG: hypothetical protein A2179_05540 [Elusimicrobia bacterium GWC2_63_65]